MGLLDKLFSALKGRPDSSTTPTPPPSPKVTPARAPAPSAAGQAPKADVNQHEVGGLVFKGTITGPATTAPAVSAEAVAARVTAHAFISAQETPQLKTAHEWWREDTHKRRRREGSDKAYAWISPFVPLDIAKRPELQVSQEWGPHGATGVAGDLRKLIREKRKAKEPHTDLLMALYGASVAADFSECIRFEGRQPHYMARFVDIRELEALKIEYATLGYKGIRSLSKTDVKWLVEALGEPSSHKMVVDQWPDVRRNTIARYCWHEFNQAKETAKALRRQEPKMADWLSELFRRGFEYQRPPVDSTNFAAELEHLTDDVDVALAATSGPFVVADLETTGLSAAVHEVLELAAVKVGPDGTVLGEFSALVRGPKVPAEIARITGISQELADREGHPLSVALKAFANFVGTQPLFFHNAPFDKAFLDKAGTQAKLKLANPVHDTLPLARQAWPELGAYKLAVLAEHVGAPTPNHRALADAKATLAVLLAARKQLG